MSRHSKVVRTSRKRFRSTLRGFSACVCIAAILVSPAVGGTLTYGYDDLGRLVRVTYPNGTIVDYNYDSADNRTQVVRTPPAPGASNVSLTTAYNTAGTVALLPSGSWTSLAVVAQPANGSASISGSNATFTPTSGFIGTTSFTYKAVGAGGESSPATVNVTVNAPAAPGAGNVSMSTAYNTVGSVALAPSGVWNSLAIVTQSTNGTAAISGSNATFTPNSGFIGTTSFTYKAMGPGGQSAAGTVNVTVNAPAVPTAGNVSMSTAYNTSGSVALAPGGSWTSLSIVSQPANGSAAISGSNVTFTPNSGFIGSTSFTYKATGAGGDSSPGTVNVTVNGPAPPTVSNTNLDTSYNSQGSVGLSASGAFNSFAVASQPANGSASISGSTAYFTPNSGFVGNTSFTYTASGPGGTSPPATINVNVAAPPAPSVANTSLNTSYNTQGSVGLTASGAYSAFAIASQPANGTASISGSTAYFTPATNFTGNTSFAYTASGPGGTSAPATVSVNVAAPPNQAPVCTNWNITLNIPPPPYGTNTANVNVSASNFISHCSDADGDTLSVTAPTMPYVTTINRGQVKSVPYTVSDGKGGTSTATLTITF
jgi:YD repeat-containing protein